MNRLVVGAFVRHVRFPSYGTGRIKFIHPNGISLAVEFENETGTNHDCAGHGRHNYCRWTRAESLEVFNPIRVGRPRPYRLRSLGEQLLSSGVCRSPRHGAELRHSGPSRRREG
jgi:hypothetical protein